MAVPDWLPEKIDTNGQWAEILDRLYRVFQIDFVGPGCYFLNSPVWWDQRKKDGEYEEGFWHLITRENYAVDERLYDPHRAECLPWCRPCLVSSPDPELKIWDYRESKKRIRTYVWLEEHDYVIILQRRRVRQGEVYDLVTAYSVDGDKTKNKLSKKYNRRVT